MANKPRILLFDIETTPNEGYVWGKWQQNVIRFKKQFELLCFAWKWLDEKQTHVFGVDDSKRKDDKETCELLHRLLMQADIVVAHNGDSFDIKKTKARFIYWRLSPLKRISSVDTKKIAKNRFNFNSNSLDDLADYLGVGRKLKHEGIQMWIDCMEGCPKAWRKMKRYNKQDVLLLEKVYKLMAPWCENHPNIAKLQHRVGCPTCGSENVKKEGLRASHQGIRQQMRCKDCLSYYLAAYKK